MEIASRDCNAAQVCSAKITTPALVGHFGGLDETLDLFRAAVHRSLQPCRPCAACDAMTATIWFGRCRSMANFAEAVDLHRRVFAFHCRFPISLNAAGSFKRGSAGASMFAASSTNSAIGADLSGPMTSPSAISSVERSAPRLGGCCDQHFAGSGPGRAILHVGIGHRGRSPVPGTCRRTGCCNVQDRRGANSKSMSSIETPSSSAIRVVSPVAGP